MMMDDAGMFGTSHNHVLNDIQMTLSKSNSQVDKIAFPIYRPPSERRTPRSARTRKLKSVNLSSSGFPP
jgi:hypothetical protein